MSSDDSSKLPNTSQNKGNLNAGESEATSSGQTLVDDLETKWNYFQQLFQRLSLGIPQDEEEHEQILSDLSLKGVAEFIADEKCKNIIVMTGAGVSTSAGIPDFRSPGSGLYDQLAEYDLPHPEAIFEIAYFKEHPDPFFKLAKELYPGNYKATPCHYFMRLLEKKGLLLRSFTQNIDGLEKVAGMSDDCLVFAHGQFHTSHCINGACKKEYEQQWMKEKIFADEMPVCDLCGSLIKPDIVFFGENLPNRFFKLMAEDFPKADLLIVLGTSLLVHPFASLIDRVPNATPRLLINREKVGENGSFGGGFDFEGEKKYRDVAWLGTCDDGCFALAALLGWKEELDEIIRVGHEAFAITNEQS